MPIRTRRRLLSNLVAKGLMILLALVALIPLSMVLVYVVVKGFPVVTHLDFFIHSERPVGIPGGGVGHAIIGTVLLVGMASLAAIPIGILGGIYLVEYGRNRYGDAIRLASDVLVGAPSIAIGLFAYALLVRPLHHYSALAGSVALGVLMLPVVVRTTEAAIALVPGALREAGLALGLPRWRVGFQLVLPAAIPGVVTGALLAVARAAGETAPLLFTTLGTVFFNTSPMQATAALPLIVYHDALVPYPELQQQAWGAALLLVTLVLLTNLASRFALRRQLRLAGKIA